MSRLKKYYNGNWIYADEVLPNSMTSEDISYSSSTEYSNNTIGKEVNTKITNPSGGETGYVLKKTSSGEEWAEETGTTYTSTNPISITNNDIGLKYDNDTIKINTNGQIYADIEPIVSYNDLTNKPSLNGITISGSKTTDDYGLASKHIRFEVTLLSSGWDSTTKTQEVTVNGILSTDDIIVGPSYSSVSLWDSCNILCSNLANDKLTFICNTIPDSNVSVIVFDLNGAMQFADVGVY